MTVGIYIRVSTDEQVKDGFSISAQREKLKAYCKVHDWDDYKFYVDEGISAKDTARPQLQKLINHIEEGKIKTVLVYRLDRLTRSVLDLYKLLETFDECGCTFKSATEVYDTGSAMGRLFITLVAALAQWERENLGERVRMGQIEKARQGKYSAKEPFGFNKDEEDRLIINEEERKILLLMKKKIEDGYSIRRLANYLDNSGIPPVRGYKWHIRSVLNFLTNPALYGAVKWLDEIYENCHPKIFGKEEFNNLQVLISSRQNFKTRETYSIHIFQTKIICPSCGSRLTCERSKYFRKRDNAIVENNHYRCQVCALNKRPSIMVSEKKMEQAFVNYMRTLVVEELPALDEEPDDEREALIKQLKVIERQREKYQKAWSLDRMTDDEFASRMDETSKTYEEVKMKLTTLLPATNKPHDKEKMLEIVSMFKVNWSKLNDLEKKEFMNTFVEGIEFEKDGVNARIHNVYFY